MGLLSRIFKARSAPPDTRDHRDVAGEWQGYYTQHHDRHPIEAVLTQDRGRISGTMTDIQTESESSLFDAAAEAGLPPGADERLDTQIRQMIPGSGNAPIRAKAVLPEKSQLDGLIDGSLVKFTKVYQGQHFVGFQVGDTHLGQIREGHTVEYSGRLSGDGSLIEGKWRIHSQESPKGHIEGFFVLQRVQLGET